MVLGHALTGAWTRLRGRECGRVGVGEWLPQVADMRTLCVGVAEKPANVRLLSDKWLGEIGYAICVSSCSGPSRSHARAHTYTHTQPVSIL